jgi:hypothetical protein
MTQLLLPVPVCSLGAKIRCMSTPATTTVEIDRELLSELRERSPGRSDRELLEDLAASRLGDETIARMREAFADVDPQAIESEAVNAVREVRHEIAAEQAATGPQRG